MNVTVNGEPCSLAPHATLVQLIAELALQGKRLAVEVNGEIVSRSQYGATILHESDRIEIVQAIGGG
jgi:sulfur carrier protein